MIETLVALVLGFGGWVVALILMTKSAELYKKYSKNQKPEGYYVGDPNGVPLNWINHKSKLICPHCGHEKTITMPSTFCQYILECTNCKTVIKAKTGDCCVFCSYGDINCPPIQKNSGE